MKVAKGTSVIHSGIFELRLVIDVDQNRFEGLSS
jgi:hypothetical protein